LPAGDVRKLKGIENGYRLRIGSVRVLFEKIGETISVIKIDNRGDVYKQRGDFNVCKGTTNQHT